MIEVTPEMFVREVARVTAGTAFHNSPALAAFGLCTELAEFTAEPSAEEAGDVLFHVAMLCPVVELSLGYMIDNCHTIERSEPLDQVDVLVALDQLKKLLGGTPGASRLRAAGALVAVVGMVTGPDRPAEQSMRACVVKMAKRFPNNLPCEVRELVRQECAPRPLPCLDELTQIMTSPTPEFLDGEDPNAAFDVRDWLCLVRRHCMRLDTQSRTPSPDARRHLLHIAASALTGLHALDSQTPNRKPT